MRSAFENGVFAQVVRAIEQTTGADARGISRSTRLSDDLALGKLGRLKLAISLEEVFNLELPDEALGRFVVVADLVSYLSRRYFRDTESSPFDQPSARTEQIVVLRPAILVQERADLDN